MNSNAEIKKPLQSMADDDTAGTYNDHCNAPTICQDPVCSLSALLHVPVAEVAEVAAGPMVPQRRKNPSCCKKKMMNCTALCLYTQPYALGWVALSYKISALTIFASHSVNKLPSVIKQIYPTGARYHLDYG